MQRKQDAPYQTSNSVHWTPTPQRKLEITLCECAIVESSRINQRSSSKNYWKVCFFCK